MVKFCSCVSRVKAHHERHAPQASGMMQWVPCCKAALFAGISSRFGFSTCPNVQAAFSAALRASNVCACAQAAGTDSRSERPPMKVPCCNCSMHVLTCRLLLHLSASPSLRCHVASIPVCRLRLLVDLLHQARGQMWVRCRIANSLHGAIAATQVEQGRFLHAACVQCVLHAWHRQLQLPRRQMMQGCQHQRSLSECMWLAM